MGRISGSRHMLYLCTFVVTNNRLICFISQCVFVLLLTPHKKVCEEMNVFPFLHAAFWFCCFPNIFLHGKCYATHFCWVIFVFCSSQSMHHCCNSLQLIAMRTLPDVTKYLQIILIWITIDLRISLSGSPCRTSCLDRTTSAIPSHPPSCRAMAAPHAASSG